MNVNACVRNLVLVAILGAVTLPDHAEANVLIIPPGAGEETLLVLDGTALLMGGGLTGYILYEQFAGHGTQDGLLWGNGVMGVLNLAIGGGILAWHLIDDSDEDDTAYFALAGVQMGVGLLAVLLSLFAKRAPPDALTMSSSALATAPGWRHGPALTIARW